MKLQPRFLCVDDVLALHAVAIEDQGGDTGLRDRGMLESAIALPRQSSAGEYLHTDIPAIAAAYAFHLCQNHPFVDGNKRAAAAAMIAFLSDNDWSFDATTDEAESTFLHLAQGEFDKHALTRWLGQHSHEKPRMELREFFRRVDGPVFTRRFLSLLPGETSTNPEEFTAREREAASVMPVLTELAQQQLQASQEGDATGKDRITMVAVTFLALHALAEDAGYEW